MQAKEEARQRKVKEREQRQSRRTENPGPSGSLGSTLNVTPGISDSLKGAALQAGGPVLGGVDQDVRLLLGSNRRPADVDDTATLAWPRFVPVIRLMRSRTLTDCFSWAATNEDAFFTVKYQQELAGYDVERADIVLTPQEVHEKLRVHYQRQLMKGWPHGKVMARLTDVGCGLLVLWKRPKSFSGSYDAAKLKVAWLLNIVMLLLVIALLLWDLLSYYGEIPFGQVLGTMVVADLTGLASALFIPLLLKSAMRVLYERSASAQKAKATAQQASATDSQPALPEHPELASATPALQGGPGHPVRTHFKTAQDPLVALKRATDTKSSTFPFIAAALRENTQRYEVARHIVRRTYAAYERLPLGSVVNHPDRGRGTISEVLPDLRRVVRFDKNGEMCRYTPHSLYTLMLGQPRELAGAQGSRACGEPTWDALATIHDGAEAALRFLEHDEVTNAGELNALQALPSLALRQRAIDQISTRAHRQRRRDVEREKAERLEELERELEECTSIDEAVARTARAVLEGQAFAQLALIASDHQDERWLCTVEQAAKAQSKEELRRELLSLGVAVTPAAPGWARPGQATPEVAVPGRAMADEERADLLWRLVDARQQRARDDRAAREEQRRKAQGVARRSEEEAMVRAQLERREAEAVEEARMRGAAAAEQQKVQELLQELDGRGRGRIHPAGPSAVAERAQGSQNTSTGTRQLSVWQCAVGTRQLSGPVPLHALPSAAPAGASPTSSEGVQVALQRGASSAAMARARGSNAASARPPLSIKRSMDAAFAKAEARQQAIEHAKRALSQNASGRATPANDAGALFELGRRRSSFRSSSFTCSAASSRSNAFARDAYGIASRSNSITSGQSIVLGSHFALRRPERKKSSVSRGEAMNIDVY